MNSHSVIISLASNHKQKENLYQAIQCLAQILSQCHYTDEIWTEPVGASISSSNPTRSLPLYLNQLVEATTDMPIDRLQAFLKETELRLGRDDDCRRQGIVPIDLDLLLYDDQRFHLRDWSRPYVTALLPQLSIFKEQQSMENAHFVVEEKTNKGYKNEEK